MNEPTSSRTPREFTRPRDLIAQLQSRGVGVSRRNRVRDVGVTALPTLGANTTGGLVRGARSRRRIGAIVRDMAQRPPDLDRPITLFSDGNQQTAIIARWLHAGTRIVVFDEPTRGIDVGARREVYRLIETMTGQGRA